MSVRRRKKATCVYLRQQRLMETYLYLKSRRDEILESISICDISESEKQAMRDQLISPLKPISSGPDPRIKSMTDPIHSR